jgi:cytoskeletal protein CcmA (bactofilin family)
MLGSSKKNQKQSIQNSRSAPKASGINSIVHGTTVEGSLTSKSDIRIDGVLKGALKCDGKVIIGPDGHIEGDITCNNAVVEGKFEGTIQVSDTLQVREKAVINGDISTDKLVVQAGAIFNVNCRMGGQMIGDYKKKKQKLDLPSDDSKEALKEKELSIQFNAD